jgi:GT2 family glycosyltransferase
MRVSVVIPTLGRGEVLLQTLREVLLQEPPPQEILVVDQTPDHAPEILESLTEMEKRGEIRWIRRSRPSIPASMNTGLLGARGEVVLFLDDDVAPAPRLIAEHLEAHRQALGEVISGQVLQPGESPTPLAGSAFSFRSSIPQEVSEVIGCNFSVRREFALGVGGFDERFVGAGYRFEADFCDRAREAGGRIFHVPTASLRHLKAPRGGTRASGSHLTTVWPGHAVGEYYYLLRRRPRGAVWRFLIRPLRSVRTRHHLRRPWWIPPTLCAETLAMLWAVTLVARAPILVTDANRKDRNR